jgi:hypothetical protein
MIKRSASCSTCQWYQSHGNLCKEPRNVEVTHHYMPGGDGQFFLSPLMGVLPNALCDFYAARKEPNLRYIEPDDGA